MNPSLIGMARRLKVTGSVTGSGTLPIPVGTFSVEQTARGGTGGDNSWYDPGQPYIAEDVWNAWQWSSLTLQALATSTTVTWDGHTLPFTGNVITQSSGNDRFYGVWSLVNTSAYGWAVMLDTYISQRIQIAQPYIAPSSGGGPYYGPATTSSLNGVAQSWTGGYGSGVLGTTSTQILQSPLAAALSLTYSVGSGGAFNYQYYR